jgi:type II secretory ATPase GspE/PulE/Tfp pilus assembly ATPase PilB-like protein
VTPAATAATGRVGLHELLIASDTIKKLIERPCRGNPSGLSRGRYANLEDDGIEKVLQGITDMP